jgi:predicted dehydrogenase
MNEGEPLGLGLIGCGAFGQFCLEAFATLDSVRVAAVADVRCEAADAFARQFGVAAHHDPAALIARDDVQIVHIATPPSTHHELVMAAAAAGKHVLCEKPLATRLEHADEMLTAAKGAGVLVPVNFVLRHNPVTAAAKAVIDSGLLGRPLSAQLTNCAGDTPLGPGHWFWDKSVSGGIFIEHGVHFFDLYTHWLGPGRVIFAHVEAREGTGQQDRETCTIRHDNGALARHYHGFDQMTLMDRTDHRLIFEQGDLRVDGWIPLRMTIDAAVDDAAVEKLADLCPTCRVDTIETFDDKTGQTTGRGRARRVSRRIRLEYCPQPDKQALYAQSIRDLLADQVAAIGDSSHVRRITEQNGRDALVLAVRAADMAAGKQP